MSGTPATACCGGPTRTGSWSPKSPTWRPAGRWTWRAAREATPAPGGTLLVIGHDLANLTSGYGGPQDSAVLFPPDDVVADLAGLEVVRAEQVRRPVSTDAGEA